MGVCPTEIMTSTITKKKLVLTNLVNVLGHRSMYVDLHSLLSMNSGTCNARGHHE